jgi:PAS domain S-box-containing protein
LNDEQRRLDELQRYDILDTEREPAFDRLTELAAIVCAAPISLVTCIDETRQWFKARHGVELDETPRGISFCAWALLERKTMVVEDCLQDSRFAGNPFVTGAEQIRFYAGAPLISPRGFSVGTLCVLDRRPRTLSPEQKRALELLRDEVMQMLENRRELFELRRAESMRQEAVEALLATKVDLEARIELRTREVKEVVRRLAEAQAVAHVGSWEWSVIDNRVLWSEELYRIYNVEHEDFKGTYEGFLSRVHPEDLEHTQAVIGDAFQRPKRFTYDHRIVRTDGAVRMLHTVGEVITNGDGKPLRMVGSCWDVTDQWEATHELERAATVVQLLVDAIPDPVLVVGEENRVVAANRPLLALLALPSLAPGSDAAPVVEQLGGLAVESRSFGAHGRLLTYRPV